MVDDREQRGGLVAALAERSPLPVRVGRLGIGDVEIGPRVLVERKTVRDLVASIRDGRLFRQAYALNGACKRPLLIVEGRDAVDVVGVPPDSLRGALLALTIGYRVPMLRTGSTEETAELIAHLAWQERRRLARRDGVDTAPLPGRIAADMLGVIPGVGDFRAQRLVRRFGSLGGVLAAAEADLRAVAGVGPATARAIRRAAEDRCPDDDRPSVAEESPHWRAACGSA